MRKTCGDTTRLNGCNINGAPNTFEVINKHVNLKIACTKLTKHGVCNQCVTPWYCEKDLIMSGFSCLSADRHALFNYFCPSSYYCPVPA